MRQSEKSSAALSLANNSRISVSEEYIIHDGETGLELLETRLPSLLDLALQDQALLDQLEEEAEQPTDRSNNLSLGILIIWLNITQCSFIDLKRKGRGLGKKI